MKYKANQISQIHGYISDRDTKEVAKGLNNNAKILKNVIERLEVLEEENKSLKDRITYLEEKGGVVNVRT